MDKANPLQPFWYNSSHTDETSVLSQVPRDRRTRDENAGGTMFHTRNTRAAEAAEALVRKRLHDQDDIDHKRRSVAADSSDAILTSDDDHIDRLPGPSRTLYKTSSRPSNASSESVYHFNRIPSSPPAYLSQHDIPSSPQRAPEDDQNNNNMIQQDPQHDPDHAFFTSQATMVPYNNDNGSSDSESTVDFNINTLNRVHGYISSDYLASEPTFNDQYNDDEVNAKARTCVARSIEEGDPKLHMENMGLKTLPDDVEDLTNLVCWGRGGIEIPKIEIYASHNKLRILPPSLFNISNLSVLSLRDNKLKKIPGKISHLQKLTYLSLVNNEIKVLPYQILKLPLLTNLLVRPNVHLIELKSQDPSAYYCVADENSDHDVDVRRYVSKLKWCNLPISSSSQITSLSDREICEKMTPAPTLSELTLRKFCNYRVTLTETMIWKRNIPIHRQKMITKAIQKGIYEETCSVCDQITVNPIAKALEWWDFRYQGLVPVRRNFCCASCVQTWLDDVDHARRVYENVDDIDQDEDMIHQQGQDDQETSTGNASRVGAGGLPFDDDF